MRWAALAAVLLTAGSARAERPTEGGLWRFDAGDEVTSFDAEGGGLRVHYSVAGPNSVFLGDEDADGVPDYVTRVAATTSEALAVYTGLGLRAPVSEGEAGVGELGGSGALDVYLIDFGGAADGLFGVDGCAADGRCAGYLVIENDFKSYGYASTTEAIDTVASHELFHAVQAAYAGDLPGYFSEGTAVWAEKVFRAGSEDFLGFCDAYLADTGRSINRPPAGPVPAFAYGSALWWDFLISRHDDSLMDALLVAAAEAEPLVAAGSLLEARGDSLAEAWRTFVAWNLATGERAGRIAGYPYAAELGGISAEMEGTDIADDERFFPASARYYRVDHAGGPLWFGLAEAAPGLQFALHAAVDGAVEEALATWDGAEAGARALGEPAAGELWISAANPAAEGAVIRAHLCTAGEASALVCVHAEPEEEGAEPEAEEAEEGCGCRTDRSGAGWLAAVVVLAVRRRRSAREGA